jgi:hypothetical protein
MKPGRSGGALDALIWIFMILLAIASVAMAAVIAIDRYTLIGEGAVEDFKLVECPVGQYAHIRVEIISESTQWGHRLPTVVFAGEIPKGALAYCAALCAGDETYGLLLTVRTDGIGCLPTDYPYPLTLRVYGKH